MAGNALGIVPLDVADPDQLYRFLSRLMEQLDVALGHRAAATTEATSATVEDLEANGSTDSIVGITSEALTPLTERLDTIENNLAITDPSVTTVDASATYVEAEIQSIADNTIANNTAILTLISRLETAGIIKV
jgi:hypothetical protein